MREKDLRKLLQEAAGPEPLPAPLRARLEEALQDEAGRALLGDADAPEPLRPLLRKRLERQLTASHRARRAYRRMRIMSAVAASLILIIGVTYVASIGTVAGYRGSASPTLAPSDGPTPAKSPKKPTKGSPAPGKGKGAEPAAVNHIPALKEDPKPTAFAVEPSLPDSRVELFARTSNACTPGWLEGEAVGYATVQQRPTPSPTSTGSPPPSPSPAPTTQETASAASNEGSSANVQQNDPPPTPTPTPTPTYSPASTPIIDLAATLSSDPRPDDYWVLLMTYENTETLECTGGTPFGEWRIKKEGQSIELPDDTIARGTYIFRVVLQPFNTDHTALVSEPIVSTIE